MRRMLPMVLGSLLLAACQRQADSGTPPPPPPPDVNNPAVQAAMADPMDAILAGDWRSDKNKARDVYRHPG